MVTTPGRKGKNGAFFGVHGPRRAKVFSRKVSFSGPSRVTLREPVGLPQGDPNRVGPEVKIPRGSLPISILSRELQNCTPIAYPMAIVRVPRTPVPPSFMNPLSAGGETLNDFRAKNRRRKTEISKLLQGKLNQKNKKDQPASKLCFVEAELLALLSGPGEVLLLAVPDQLVVSNHFEAP